jgi:hypothetical protein
MKTQKVWTAAEDALIAKMAKKFPRERIAESLGRSVAATASRASGLGIPLAYEQDFAHWLATEDKLVTEAVKAGQHVNTLFTLLAHRHTDVAVRFRYRATLKRLKAEGGSYPFVEGRTNAWKEWELEIIYNGLREGYKARQFYDLLPNRSIAAVDRKRSDIREIMQREGEL